MVSLADLPEAPEVPGPDPDTLLHRQMAFGYTLEDLKYILGPMGASRRGGDRLDGHRHAAGRALRPRPAAVQLLQAALRPGHQSPARRDPRGAGHLGLHRRRRRGEPARAQARVVPADRAGHRRSSTTTSWRGSSCSRAGAGSSRRPSPCCSWPPRGPRGLEDVAPLADRPGLRGDRGRGQPDHPLRPRRQRRDGADPVAAGLLGPASRDGPPRACGPAPGWSSSAATPARSTTSPCCWATAPARSTPTSPSRRSTT